jgi:endonuclease I
MLKYSACNFKEFIMTENATAPEPTLSIADIRNLLAIIDVASKRGAFQTKEFVAVGEIYAKVEAFLDSKEPKSAPTEETKGA